MGVRPELRRVLVTGDRGLVGRWLTRWLTNAGYAVTGVDALRGEDVRDSCLVAAAAGSSDVVVHCAALNYLHPDGDRVTRTSVEGALNVLAAAESAGHERVVLLSSAQVFGTLTGEAVPVSFPLRDNHPLLATSPYARSKVECEDLCEAFSARTGIATVCLRPVHVWVPGRAADRRRRWKRQPTAEWEPRWEYGAFLDVRDLCAAVQRAIEAPVEGHHRLLLAAADAAATVPPRELASRLCPGVPFEPGWPPHGDAWASLVDTSPARTVLGWEPRYTWAAESRLSLPGRVVGRLRRARQFGIFGPR